MRMEKKQQDQQLRSSHSPTRKLDVGQTVVARDYRGVNWWVPGVITSRSGPLSYEVRVATNTVWRRHIDQLRESAITVNPNTDDSATQPNPAVFLATPQSTYNRVPRIPICGGSKEAVIPDQDINTMLDNPSSSHCKHITSSPETPCRRYPLDWEDPQTDKTFVFFLLLLFVFGDGGRNVTSHMFTSGLVNITCAHMLCG